MNDDELKSMEAELLALQDDALQRKERIDKLQKEIGRIKNVRRKEVHPRRRFTVSSTADRKMSFGEPLLDPAVYIIEIRGVLLNTEELETAGHRIANKSDDHGSTHKLITQRFLFNGANGRIIGRTGGGWSIVSDGNFGVAPMSVYEAIADRFNRSKGAEVDITDVIESIPDRKPM